MDKANNENIGHSLGAFISEFGVPEHLTFYGDAVQVGNKTIFRNHVRKYEIRTQSSDLRRPNENPSEGYIREVKTKWYLMQAKNNIYDSL